jgi:hypothetical protein
MTLHDWKLRSLILALGAIVWLTSVLAAPTGAQSQGSAPATQDSTTSSQDSKNANHSWSQDSNASTDSSDSAASTVNIPGSMTPLGTPNGSLRWGNFFVRDVSFTQIYDRANYARATQSSGSLGSAFSTNASLFQTDLAFDRLTRLGEVALQYQPRLAIVNGNVYPDYSNQNVSFNLLLNRSPRLSFEFRDTFSYFSSQNIYALTYVDANTRTGQTIQNNFIDGPGSFLSELANLKISYRFSPRTTLSLGPSFNYVRTARTRLGTLISRDYGGSVALGYQLSARQIVGVFFNNQYIQISGYQGNTQIYSTGVSYSRQMGPNWSIAASFAGTRNPATGVSSPWTYTGSASATRGFRRSSIGLVYARDLASGYVTNHIADRIDGFLRWQLLRALQWQVNLGDQREAALSHPISAYYGVSEFDLQLTPRISTYVNYGYRTQSGDALRVLTGHRNFVSAGIRWNSSADTSN